jgi:hypothetical protein
MGIGARRRLAMSDDLRTFLTARAADPDTIHQAMRVYVIRRSDFMSEDEMMKTLVASVGDEAKLRGALKALEQDSTLLEAASLAALSDAWANPGEHRDIERAVDGAKTQMPVIEVGVLAVVAMYAMYLNKTGGKKTENEVIRRAADGSFEVVKRSTYYGPGGPLSAITALFGKGAAS